MPPAWLNKSMPNSLGMRCLAALAELSQRGLPMPNLAVLMDEVMALTSIFEATSDGISITDLDGVIMYAEATAALLADNQHEMAANYLHVSSSRLLGPCVGLKCVSQHMSDQVSTTLKVAGGNDALRAA